MIVAVVTGRGLYSGFFPSLTNFSFSAATFTSSSVSFSIIGALTAVATFSVSPSFDVWDEITSRETKVKIRPAIISKVVFPADTVYGLHYWNGFEERALHCR